MTFNLTERQMAFVEARADEVFYGGAAGGGKSFAQVADAFLYALQYPGSKQLILRRTYTELEKSLIRTSLALYPRHLYKYTQTSHTGRFRNGSLIDFAYCDSEEDVFRYQSAEYDVIRFDELTHFTEEMYLYLRSRLRGPNSFPKQMKSTGNPGGIGHSWVKKRFVRAGEADRVFETDTGSRIFLPAKVFDNPFLMKEDPEYIKRLQSLPERHRRALLEGDWNLEGGRFFPEFSRMRHVLGPETLPGGMKHYIALDYGLDRLCALYIAVDENEKAVVYKEVCESGLIVSEAAEAVKKGMLWEAEQIFAPPDLWNRNRDTGKSTAELFADRGLYLTKVSNDRVQGWLNLKEWLRGDGEEPRLMIFDTCGELIRCLSEIGVSPKDPNDAATEPHHLTHAVDAIRYFVAGRPTGKNEEERPDSRLQRFLRYGA